MKCALFFAAILSGAAAVSTHEQDSSNDAVVKVIQMLGDMNAKCKQEKNDEQVAFAEFNTWCKMEQANLKDSIRKGGESIELLGASIGKLSAEAKVLGEEISKLQSNVADYEADMKASTSQRTKDNEAFLAEEKDYSESVDAIERALVVMQKKDQDRPGSSAALLQISEKAQIPEKAKALIASFVGMMDDDSNEAAPEANAYEFQSGGIVSLLNKLKDQFRGKLGECQKEEMNSKHAYDMKYADLKDSVENSNSDIEEKTATKARKEEQRASDKKELGSTISTKQEDETTLKDAETECEEKSLSFEEKQKLRTEEIEAIETAVGILKGDDMQTGSKNLALSQSKAATSLTQLRGKEIVAEENQNIHRKITEFLASEGNRLHSKELSMLAEKFAADPFAKVKKLIDSMLTRLLEEAHADADHEGFCDTEIGKSKVTRAKLSEDIDALTAAIEQGKSTIMSLTEEIATLTKEGADLDASRGEATKMRNKEKAQNKVTVEDSEAAAKAVAAATAVLKKFYAGASQATGFVQTEESRPIMGTDEWNALANPNFKGTVDKGHKDGMQTFGKKYQGQQDEAGGVLAMLEVIASDFNNVIADTKAAETQSQTAYDDFMTESKKNKAVKERKTSMNNADKAAAESKLQDDTKDLKGTQDELLAADRYYGKLVPQCFDKGQTFEERTKSREEEIASLKQALKILGGQ
jgi:hypothetical protein